MRPSRNNRLALLNLADTPRINDAAFRRLYRLTRTAEVDTWYTCGQLAQQLNIEHHQARPTLAALVAEGLLDRDFDQRRVAGSDRRLVTYRLWTPGEAEEGAK
ncbi:hypothetical protein ACIQ9R_36340 [Streptomyces sp. NPDC094447]|uniref:hypothetical protein n=1 Tax=Streptomyces sp. NPDC094447 TaxID=3366062 RepID=UPI0038219F6E